MKLKELKLWNKFHNTPDQKFFEVLKKYKDVDKAIERLLASNGSIEPEAVLPEPTKKEKLILEGRWNYIKNCPVKKSTPPPSSRPAAPPTPVRPTEYVEDERLEYRHVGIEGVEQLLWIKQDRGGFGTLGRDGPINDWDMNIKKIMQHVYGRGVVIQAGGNCGMYARFYARYFNSIHTIEPEELNFKCLSENIKEYPMIKGYRAALGEVPGYVKISGGGYRNCGTFRVRELKQEDELGIEMTTIDEMDLNHVDLIHLDLEGFEEKALRGAMHTIKKFKPTVITERNRGENLLSSLGYKQVRLPKMDVLFYHPDTKKKSEIKNHSRKVIIVGSGHSAEKLKSLDTSEVKVVTVNNAWMVSDKWDFNIHAPDHPRDRRPKDYPSEKKVLSSGGEHGYVSAVQRHGGLQKCGFSITLATAYWVLENLNPNEIGFLGCDMDYQPQEGKTAFYGVGVDIQKRNEPDPDRMAKRYGRNDPEKYLRDVYRRFFDIAKSKGIDVYNISGVSMSRLPYPMKEDFI